MELSTTYKIPFTTVKDKSTDPSDFEERTIEFIRSIIFDYTCYRILFFFVPSSQAGMGYDAARQIDELLHSYNRKMEIVNGRLDSGNTNIPYLEDLEQSKNFIQRQNNIVSKPMRNANKYARVSPLTTKI